jgi:two-component system chemotaxis response regulator CheB
MSPPISKIRVLIVDDSVVMRRLVSEVLSADSGIEVAGWAAHGRLALAKIPQVNPDCITLDVEMPEMDGIATLVEIRKTWPRLPVIMFSTLTERGAVKTIEALSRGATDYVAKPANVGNVNDSILKVREELIPKIKVHCAIQRRLPQPPSPVSAAPLATRSSTVSHPLLPCDLVCIAASTGGPNALTSLLSGFPKSLSVPVAIVVHMPPIFTKCFADRLNEACALTVQEAQDGQRVEPGQVYVAPGGRHMELVRRRAGVGLSIEVKLTSDPPENSCRPAADVLFRSASKLGAAVLGVVLTGMGSDGLRGARLIAEAGGRVLAQDEASSVVWGMPGAIVQDGLAEKVLPLDSMAAAIVQRVARPVAV